MSQKTQRLVARHILMCNLAPYFVLQSAARRGRIPGLEVRRLRRDDLTHSRHNPVQPCTRSTTVSTVPPASRSTSDTVHSTTASEYARDMVGWNTARDTFMMSEGGVLVGVEVCLFGKECF